MRVGEVRCVEIDLADPARAAEFYSNVWNLKEIGRENGSIYFRGTGPCHHVLAIHHRPAGPAIRRIVFNAKDKAAVDALCQQVCARAPTCEDPKALTSPGGGYGFGFTDPHHCNYAVVTGVNDHTDKAGREGPAAQGRACQRQYADQKATMQFMIDALGLKLVDESGPLMFMNADSTDHSSMVVGKHTKPTLNHVAFEMPDLDSVMRGVGRMKDNGYPTEWGPGPPRRRATTCLPTLRGRRNSRSNTPATCCRSTTRTSSTARNTGSGRPAAPTSGASPIRTRRAGSGSGDDPFTPGAWKL